MKHIVKFETWCNKCKHREVEESGDPCNDCLAEPFNDDSRKPTFWEDMNSSQKKQNA